MLLPRLNAVGAPFMQHLCSRILRTSPVSALTAVSVLTRLHQGMATDVEYRDRPPIDAHYVSDAPDVIEACRLFRRFTVGVGCRLTLTAPAGVTEVDVGVGELEEIAVEVTSEEGDIEPQATFEFTESNGAVAVTGTPVAMGKGLKMKAWVPERFCSVDVSADGAAVKVKSVIEASLRVHSGGGAVSLGTVRASDAEVHTGGGALNGAITAYNVGVSTGGGPLSLRRLVGRRVELGSGGGAVELKVVYGDSVHIRSGGGEVTINSTKVSESGLVDSGGGSVKVLGADGCLTLNSHGGDVEVQMHAEAKSVAISSEDGAVAVALPTDSSFNVRARADGGLQLESGIAVASGGEVGDTAATGVVSVQGTGMGRKAQAVAGVSWREAGMQELMKQQQHADGEASREGGGGGEVGTLVVEAGRGRATFRVQSWMDALAKKFAAPDREAT